MKNTQNAESLQANLDSYISLPAQAAELGLPLSPQDLPRLLQVGFAQMLKAALRQERQFHLDETP